MRLRSCSIAILVCGFLILTQRTSVVRAQCGECLQWSTSTSTNPNSFFLGAYDTQNGTLIAISQLGRIHVESNGAWVNTMVPVQILTPLDASQRFVYSRSQRAFFNYLIGSMDKVVYTPLTGAITATPLVGDPLGIFGSSMCEFEPHESLIIFGGFPVDPTDVQNTTVEFDPVLQTYTPINTLHAPSPRSHPAMAFDALRERIVLFGGTDNYVAGAGMDDTWEFDGADWTHVAPVDEITPAARWNASMAFDSSRGVMVMVSGLSGGTQLRDTWEWDGTHWTPRFPGFSHGPTNVSRSLVFVQHEGSFRHFVASSFTYTLSGVAANPPTIDPPVTPLHQLNLGGFAILSVTAQGENGVPFAYQWRKDGVPIPGATGVFYVVGPVGAGHEGDYDCVVRYATAFTFDCGNTISAPIHVEVLTPLCHSLDADKDGAVNLKDFAIFQQQFGQSCP